MITEQQSRDMIMWLAAILGMHTSEVDDLELTAQSEDFHAGIKGTGYTVVGYFALKATAFWVRGTPVVHVYHEESEYKDLVAARDNFLRRVRG